jgi:nucleoside-diphosphate-sugar epimerase
MILITGATGTNGREIVKQLSDKGVKVRVMIGKRENAGLAHSSNIEYVMEILTRSRFVFCLCRILIDQPPLGWR